MEDLYAHELIYKLRMAELERRHALRRMVAPTPSRTRRSRPSLRERAAARLIALAVWLAPSAHDTLYARREGRTTG